MPKRCGEGTDARRPALPPGFEWADDEEAMMVALQEMEKCAPTLKCLAAVDRGEPVEDDLGP